MAYYIGTDIGGTFTDCVVLDDKGNITVSKASSTPPQFQDGLLQSLVYAAEQLDVTLPKLLERTKVFSHGCTVATNTMINKNGAKVGVLTTKGFEETLYLMRGSAYCQGLPLEDWYRKPQNERPFDIVPVSQIHGVTERIDRDGEVIVPLSEDDVLKAGNILVNELGCEAISICFLWSFKNPRHEERTRQIILEKFPGVFVNTSSGIIPLLGEYERFSTTALNSYLRPSVQKYITQLSGKLEQNNLRAQFYMMQANGGLLPAASASEHAVRILHSGPTGGVLAAKIVGDLTKRKNIITADMGGTSFDISVIVDGAMNYTTKSFHERHVVATPMVDVSSIGAGGGSLAAVEQGVLKVGPKSAGANPGPVCYRRGGTQPTVTDANVVLGYVNPDFFLGGKMTLDKDGAAKAIQQHIAKPLGLSVEEAAHGIYEIVNAHMSDAIRFYCLSRGFDPRDFDVFLFGGATPAHSAGIGGDLEVKSIIIPLAGLATVLSAFGIANSDVMRMVSQSQSMPLIEENAEALAKLYETMKSLAEKDLLDDGFQKKRLSFKRVASMRYHLQLTDVDVELPQKTHAKNFVNEVTSIFDARYAALYGESAGYKEGGRWVISQFVQATGKTPKGKITAQRESSSDASKALKGKRKAYFKPKGFMDTKIYDGDRLVSGNRVSGPCVLEMKGTTVVIPPNFVAELDEYRNIIIKKS